MQLTDHCKCYVDWSTTKIVDCGSLNRNLPTPYSTVQSPTIPILPKGPKIRIPTPSPKGMLSGSASAIRATAGLLVYVPTVPCKYWQRFLQHAYSVLYSLHKKPNVTSSGVNSNTWKDCSYYPSKRLKCCPSALTQASAPRVDCLVNDILLQTRPCSSRAAEDRISIENLCKFNGFRVKRLIYEFPDKGCNVRSLSIGF